MAAVLLAVGALASASGRAAEAESFGTGDLRATLQREWTGAPGAGWVPVWVELENRGPSARTVDLRFRSWRDAETAAARVSLEAGERRTAWLPVPGRYSMGTLLVSSDGTFIGNRPVTIMTGERWPVLVLGTPEQLSSALGIEIPAGSPLPGHMFLDTPRLPDQWGALAGFLAVVVLEREGLGRPQRAALESYAMAGGHVVFAGDAAAAPALDAWRGDRTEGLGLGQVHVCPAGGSCPPPATLPLRIATAFPQKIERPRRLLPEAGRAPAGVFLLVVLLFAAAAGPGGWVLSRRRGPQAVLVLVPALSLVTCGGMAAYGAAADGLFTVHAASRTVSWLDSRNGRAATVGVTGYYAALGQKFVKLPAGSGFQPGEDWNGVSVDWSDGPAPADGFLPSRSYRELAVGRVAATRARLGWVDGGIENALGARILGGQVLVDGVLHPVGEVPDGARAAPAEPPVPFADRAAELKGRIVADLLAHVIERPLDEGEFLVAVDGAPFVPFGELRLERHPSVDLVRGRVTR